MKQEPANSVHNVGGTNLTENLKGDDTRSRQGSAIGIRVEGWMSFDLSLVGQLSSIHRKRTYLLGSYRSHPHNPENWEPRWILVVWRLHLF